MENIKSYTLLSGYKDYSAGFEIQSLDKKFIFWDTPYREWKDCPEIEYEEDRTIRRGRFKYPVRIGNLLLKTFLFHFEYSGREDAPILYFNSKCFDESYTDKSYWELKKELIKDIGETEFYYERLDQNYYSFDLKGMVMELTYTYGSDFLKGDQSTFLTIDNRREYPELLVNKEYEEILSLDEVVVFKEQYNIKSDYKRNSMIKKCPLQIQNLYKDCFIIWYDKKNQKTGFTDGKYAHIFNHEDIESLTILNILPAKGSGGVGLTVNFTTKKSQDLLGCYDSSNSCYALDKYSKEIQEKLNKKVRFEEYTDS